MKIAIIKGTSIGDFTSGIPMLVNLKKKYPKSKITFITSYKGAGWILVKNCPYIDEIVLINPEMHFFLKKLLKIRKKYFDIVIDGWPVTKKTSLLCFLLRGKIKLSCDKIKNKDCIEIEKETLKKIGINYKDTPVNFFLDNKDSQVEKILKKNKINNHRNLIGIFLGKDYDINRLWLNSKWTELINMFDKKYKIILVGGKDNRKNGNEVERSSNRNTLNLIGKLSLSESISLIKKFKIFICTNGGLMFIAYFLNIPTVVINGVSKRQWRLNSKKIINIDGKFCAKKCDGKSFKCDDPKCIKNITPEEVYRNVMKFMN